MTDRMSPRAVMTRHISKPALSLLRQANLTPGEIDLAIDALVDGKASAILRKGHALLRRIEEASGIIVVQIARRSRYLLITIEQATRNAPAWQYRELSPRRCLFSCPGQVPSTIAVGLVGLPLRHLADPMTGMEDLLINAISDTGDSWLVVDVTPVWSTF
ncbi:hypothetical protein E2E30_04890 [Sphingomonas sp. AAP5]|uniref:hypothetical protein n=1 Tax=Sphingomonas sp. AAP5 TaxID=1523415 RepID=UPI0010574742|nr:hypothetical protein [Sphingomonas sp. AAP5]QBM75166.1 hypothetical protein E2E30_04890 [Sphingomonas sp. AAP5]